ncbi:MAG: hypothetical protein V4750_09640 [Pseudomonadota bacterium]
MYGLSTVLGRLTEGSKVRVVGNAYHPQDLMHWLARQDGWHAVRLDAIAPPRPAAFEALRGVVLQDWTDATLSDQRSAAVKALARQYRVKNEAPA